MKSPRVRYRPVRLVLSAPGEKSNPALRPRRRKALRGLIQPHKVAEVQRTNHLQVTATDIQHRCRHLNAPGLQQVSPVGQVLSPRSGACAPLGEALAAKIPK